MRWDWSLELLVTGPRVRLLHGKDPISIHTVGVRDVTFPPEVQQMLQGGSEEKVEETEPFLKGVPTIQEHNGSLREYRRKNKTKP